MTMIITMLRLVGIRKCKNALQHLSKLEASFKEFNLKILNHLTILPRPSSLPKEDLSFLSWVAKNADLKRLHYP